MRGCLLESGEMERVFISSAMVFCFQAFAFLTNNVAQEMSTKVKSFDNSSNGTKLKQSLQETL
jgi:hypothetical protein